MISVPVSFLFLTSMETFDIITMMSKSNKQVKASLDLSDLGTLHIEGTQDDIVKLIERLREKGSGQTHTQKNPKKRKQKKKKTSSNINLEQPKQVSDLFPKEKIEDFKNFIDEKTPSNHQEYYTTFAYWIKQKLDLKDVSINEMWTAYKIIGVRPPKKLIQVFRDTKKLKMWFENTQGKKGRYFITSVGETFVEHDLPAKTK